METKGQGLLGGEAVLAYLTLGQGQLIFPLKNAFFLSEKNKIIIKKFLSEIYFSATTRLE